MDGFLSSPPPIPVCVTLWPPHAPHCTLLPHAIELEPSLILPLNGSSLPNACQVMPQWNCKGLSFTLCPESHFSLIRPFFFVSSHSFSLLPDFVSSSSQRKAKSVLFFTDWLRIHPLCTHCVCFGATRDQRHSSLSASKQISPRILSSSPPQLVLRWVLSLFIYFHFFLSSYMTCM